MSAKILIVDDEENLCFTLERFLTAEGYEVTTADTCSNALALLGEMAFDLIFADIILKGRSGIDILREVKQRQLPGVVVMITGAPTIDSASEAVRLGAFDYLPKPVTQQALIRVARAALRFKALADEKEKYRLNLAAIFKSVKDAIIMVDENLAVIEVNAAAKDICMVAHGHAIGKPVSFMESACCQRCLSALSETIRTQRSSPFWASGLTDTRQALCHLMMMLRCFVRSLWTQKRTPSVMMQKIKMLFHCVQRCSASFLSAPTAYTTA